MKRSRVFSSRVVLVTLIVLSALVLSASAAFAETVVSKSFDRAVTKARWTPEALAGARPLPLPRVEVSLDRPRQVPVKAAAPADDFVEVFPSLPQAPTLSDAEAARFRQRLFDFTAEELRRLRDDEDVEPAEKNYGSSGLDYTSSRLIPSSAVEEFPYRAVGRLFFSDGTDNFVCTAAVIARRLVVTAGHCVHDGPGNGFFEDFLFIPAYFNGDAPFGTWSVTEAFVTADWAGDADVPHPDDFALLQMEDQNGMRIADVAGKLAFVPDQLADNHLTLLGYAGNLDGGEEIHQVNSGDFFDFLDGTVAYGSDMEGGSSGGPWIQNFNRKAAGQGGGRNRARLAIVGVTSFGFVHEGIRAQGASIFSRNFRVLRQDACFAQNGNC
jgi:V8-like Glu-specific endopeptidase